MPYTVAPDPECVHCDYCRTEGVHFYFGNVYQNTHFPRTLFIRCHLHRIPPKKLRTELFKEYPKEEALMMILMEE